MSDIYTSEKVDICATNSRYKNVQKKMIISKICRKHDHVMRAN